MSLRYRRLKEKSSLSFSLSSDEEEEEPDDKKDEDEKDNEEEEIEKKLAELKANEVAELKRYATGLLWNTGIAIQFWYWPSCRKVTYMVAASYWMVSSEYQLTVPTTLNAGQSDTLPMCRCRRTFPGGHAP